MSSKWSPDGALTSAGRHNAEEGNTSSLTRRKLHFSPCCLKADPLSAHTAVFGPLWLQVRRWVPNGQGDVHCEDRRLILVPKHFSSFAFHFANHFRCHKAGDDGTKALSCQVGNKSQNPSHKLCHDHSGTCTYEPRRCSSPLTLCLLHVAAATAANEKPAGPPGSEAEIRGRPVRNLFGFFLRQPLCVKELDAGGN